MSAIRLPDTQAHAAKEPTIGVWATGDPRVDEESRQRALKRLEEELLEAEGQLESKLREQLQETTAEASTQLTELEAARLIVRRAAAAMDSKSPDATRLCAMAKRFATDACFTIANEALQLHGGYGYLKDFPLERHVRDLRVHQILEGTNEIMRVIVARHLIGR